MVPHPRVSLGARALRPLGAPVPLRVRVGSDGQPLAVRRRGRPGLRAVARVQDCWRVDDEWWRERPISRLYYALLLDDGTFLVGYRDLVADAWFEQRDPGAASSSRD